MARVVSGNFLEDAKRFLGFLLNKAQNREKKKNSKIGNFFKWFGKHMRR